MNRSRGRCCSRLASCAGGNDLSPFTDTETLSSRADSQEARRVGGRPLPSNRNAARPALHAPLYQPEAHTPPRSGRCIAPCGY
jgi:hypothetical protein